MLLIFSAGFDWNGALLYWNPAAQIRWVCMRLYEISQLALPLGNI